jgi:hypothetical protein
VGRVVVLGPLCFVAALAPPRCVHCRPAACHELAIIEVLSLSVTVGAQVLDRDPGKEVDKRLVQAALKEMGTWEHSAEYSTEGK